MFSIPWPDRGQRNSEWGLARIGFSPRLIFIIIIFYMSDRSFGTEQVGWKAIAATSLV